MKNFRTTLLSVAIAWLASTSTLAAETIPPAPLDAGGAQPSQLVAGTVTAVVVKSWGFTTYLVWQYLSENWSLFGTTPISIDYTTLIDAPSFTLADLENVGADVVIVSDPSGANLQWTDTEVAALETYALAGHNLVGTFLLFQWNQYDNRALAPLWGFDETTIYSVPEKNETDPETTILKPSHCLFAGITGALDAGGYESVQVPQDDFAWNVEDIPSAVIVGLGPAGRKLVTTYDAGSYQAHYISYMPEYQSGEDVEAAQWLYNAITCTPGPISVESASWGEVKASYR